MSWTLDGKIRIHARLSNISCMPVYYWTSVSLRRLYIGQFPSLYFKPGPRRRLRQQRIKGCISLKQNIFMHHGITKWICAFRCDFFFCLFYFHLGRICDLCFSQKWWKSFHSLDKNILFSNEIIRGIQQATSISFFPSVGNQSGNLKNTHFALLGSRSEHSFPARSRVLP